MTHTGSGGHAARIIGSRIADAALRRLRVSDVAYKFGNEPRHIHVIHRLINAGTQIVEPAEPLVALGTVGENGMLVVLFGAHRDLVQGVERLVGTGKNSDQGRGGMHVFAHAGQKFRFARNFRLHVAEPVISEPRRELFHAVAL